MLISCFFFFKNFLTELASGRDRLDDIIKMAEELVKSRHSKQREIQSRQRDISKRYKPSKSNGDARICRS